MGRKQQGSAFIVAMSRVCDGVTPTVEMLGSMNRGECKMATPEGKVKLKVKELLKKHGAYWHCPVQNGMGAPSLDFIGCMKGRYFAVETKAEGKKPTPRQELTIQDIQRAGGKVFVVDGAEGMENLEWWLKDVSGA